MAFPTDWGRKCALVIQSGQVTDTETDFPALITEDTLPSEIFDADGSYPALNGGGDIRLSSDSAGNTQLACEIEKFVTDNTPADGKASIWVKVPSLSSSSNTTIYIWYNKSGETQPAEDAAYGKEAVWKSSFKMVQHMNQDPSGGFGCMVDSTSNDNDGTPNGSMTSGDLVDGKIDGSLDFDGANDYIVCGVANMSDIDAAGTLSCWAKYTVQPGISVENLVLKSSLTGAVQLGFQSNEVVVWMSGGASIVSATQPSADAWHYYVFTTTGTNHALYVDGSEVDTSTVTLQSGTTNSASITTAAWGEAFDGLIDEVHFSDITHLIGRTATEYANQNSPGTFIVEGTPETPGAVAGNPWYYYAQQ